jgi:signal transduction histidine kinase
MVLLILAVAGLIGVPFAVAARHADGVNAWLWALPQRLRGRGWGLLLIPLAVWSALLTSDHLASILEIVAGALAVIFVPRLARTAVPYAVLALGGYGPVLAKSYHDGNNMRHLYGLVLAGAGSWRTHLVLVQAGVFFIAGLWLLLRVQAPGSRQISDVVARWRNSARGGIAPAQGLLLLPVVVLVMELLGPRDWFGAQWLNPAGAIAADVAGAAASLVLVFRSRVWAATLAEAGLLVLGAYGLLIAAFWPAAPGFVYGFAALGNARSAIVGGGLQGAVLLGLGLWLAPRVMREHLAGPVDPELATRARQLSQRVQALTQTRYDAVDTAAAELRRIERDLHDGAQARLVALGMSLQAAERLFPTSPEAALALVTEAKQTSSRALTELRDLVRGIYPPVLADRGLGDAVRALALDSSHGAGMLRAQITDDGAGGADPALGTGLAGVERRLATFDGILAVSSPPGGPTIVVIEVPCVLSLPKTSSC